MAQFREEVVRTSVEPDLGVVEERSVSDGLGSRVVRTTTTETAPPLPTRSTHVVRRFWRRTPLAASTSEYATAPSYALDSGLAQFLRLSWFALGLIEALLALRFLLSLLGANERNDFAAAVYALTWALVGPFRTLFATPTAGASSFEVYTLIAMPVYFFAWWAFVRMVGLMLNRSVDV